MDDYVTFYTMLNSSSIYAKAETEGEALVNLQLAIVYPDEYKYDKNWFETNVSIKVTEKLTI